MLLLNSYSVSFFDDEKVLETTVTAIQQCESSQCPETIHLKIVKIVNFIYIYIYIFFYNEKITLKRNLPGK